MRDLVAAQASWLWREAFWRAGAARLGTEWRSKVRSVARRAVAFKSDILTPVEKHELQKGSAASIARQGPVPFISHTVSVTQ
jgi:hypothetical protein